MTPTILITRGVPASGKSTFAKNWVLADENRARVNRDDIRTALGIVGGIGNHTEETLVSQTEKTLVRAFVAAGYSVVVDATNLRAKFVKDWLQLARSLGADVEYADFPIDLAEAIRRDVNRQIHGERYVGENVIRSFFSRFITDAHGTLPTPPELDEAVAPVAVVQYVPDTALPSAYGFDLDGSLAHMTGRGPYDTSQYHTDRVDENLAATARTLHSAGHAIIVLTGRSEEFREVCEVWLLKHGIPVHVLLMRAAGDTRNDAIIKGEIFDRDVAPFYNFVAQFDDRNRVVNALRGKGISVYQVAEGDF